MSPRHPATQENVAYLEKLLHSCGEFRIGPVGLDLSGRKYFEVADMSTDQRILTILSPAVNEVTKVKDIEGITRFQFCGSFEPQGQTDAFLDLENPIGCSKTNVIYNHKLVPIYLSLMKRTMCGPNPNIYHLVTVTEKVQVGHITCLNESTMIAGIGVKADWRDKVLAVCLAFHYGVTEHFLHISAARIVEPHMFGLKDAQKAKYVSPVLEARKASLEKQRRQSLATQAVIEQEKIKTAALAKEVEEQNIQLYTELQENKLSTEAAIKKASIVDPDGSLPKEGSVDSKTKMKRGSAVGPAPPIAIAKVKGIGDMQNEDASLAEVHNIAKRNTIAEVPNRTRKSNEMNRESYPMVDNRLNATQKHMPRSEPQVSNRKISDL